MQINPNDLPWQSVYKLLIGSVLPRPIGWISTVNTDGALNLAPFSFFNVVGAHPPAVLFCPMIRTTTAAPKDTLQNVRATGEFVVNIVSAKLVEQMNLTSGEYGPEVDEFALAHLTPAPSSIVKPPRVAESLVNFECKVLHILPVGEGLGSSNVVVGEVLMFHVSDEVLIAPDKIKLDVLQPVARLAGNLYARTTDIFELKRPSGGIQ